MLRAALDFDPAIAVLLTGDGAGYELGQGFRADLERLADKGWGIEVLAWRGARNSELRTFVEARGVFVALDDFYRAITFIEGGRTSEPVSLTHRAYAALPGAPAA